ncbi:5'-nucleotidase C-terminal domain-containing protein [Myxococcus stipitatus]|uniref:bifunctional metallophosphatase/5'-nucleotidase n=1 Tax=Myxococcus stipitatus TaxID=83455 RepID=UPI001F3B64DC|nr:5'-nucleotidase C-terminal domain-containing protein [Myxococcus stipitatus]MCE9666655.1 5'-nucleotidase C-terminal domain-containing protein [Myxococcus stipitatus]
MSNPPYRPRPFRQSRLSATLVLALGALAGCEKSSPPPAAQAAAQPAPAPAKPAVPSEVTLLITGGAFGQLQPAEGKGGAAELLGQWVKDEKHCPGPVKEGQASCPDSGTVALATGDHWNGPALSSFFLGAPTAEVMGRMGYAASAMGNHELAFGKDAFVKNRAAGGFPFLAANLRVKDPALAGDLSMPAFQVFERRGLKVGVVGLASEKTVRTAMAGRAEGLEVVGYEESLTGAVDEARKAGAEVLVVLADTCVTELKPVVAKHPEWKVSVVAGGRCPQSVYTKENGVVFASLDRGFSRYLRAHITFDPAKPAAAKVTNVEGKLVDVAGGAPDAETAQLIAKWKTQLDEALGQPIGFTKAGIKQDSPQMAQWIAGAVRDSLGTDVAILNKKGIRGDLPAGPVTRGNIYTVMPFENSLLVVKLKGEDLARQLANPNALVSGFSAAGKNKFKDAKGKPLDPAKEYSVATVEYLYFGGDEFEFEKLAPEPTETGMAWQTPVVDWTKALETSEKKPLEKQLK